MPMDGKLTADQIAASRIGSTRARRGTARRPAAADPATAARRARGDDDPAGGAQLLGVSEAGRRLRCRRSPGFTNPIDRFLEKTRRDKGLKPAPRADRITLLRRAYLDLIGLPPTPAETAEFLADNSPQRLGAADRQAARLAALRRALGTPLAGCGALRRFQRLRARFRPAQCLALSRLRDPRVQPGQAVQPFLAEQIAGDELDRVTDDSLIATGFLRSYAKVGYREKDNPQFRYDYLDDMIGTIGRGVLGLTVNCARCHNHKFDPIAQKDYYQLQASLFGYVETDYPLAPKERGRGVREEDGGDRREDRAAAAEDPAARGAVSREAGAGEVQEVSRPTCSRPSPSRKTSGRRARRCWPAGDPHHVGLAATRSTA